MSNSPSNRRWVSYLLLFFGSFFVLLALQEGCYQGAVTLQGTVLSKHYSPGSSRVGSGTLSSTSSHGIKYRFTTPAGETREDFGQMLRQHWSKLTPGDLVDIEYLPATKDSRVARQTASGPVFLLIAMGLLAGGCYLRRGPRR
jgi:hypothetical protein